LPGAAGGWYKVGKMKRAVIQLKAIAETKKLSLKKIAKDTGISYAVVWSYANGTSKGIQLDDLAKLATYLKKPISALIKLEE
jgi:transcriptional regulator with XRE-family HTH domain